MIIMPKKFTRKIEDFVCENCGTKVRGSGYTNHCPKCLYSKHVDINPGDRASLCGGLMKPFGVESSHKAYVIIHKCLKCGFQKKNKAEKDDNLDLIIKISSRT